jgi:Mg2+ and Co2+ transporter CorA
MPSKGMLDAGTHLCSPDDVPGFVYRLSVLTALFLPPALITGLFGMNLDGVPLTEVHGSFWLGTGLAVISSLGTWLFLRYLDRG